MPLEKLVEEHDVLMYGESLGLDGRPNPNGHHFLRKLANLTVVNSSTTLEQLWANLDGLDPTSTDRLRPRWDTYFMVSTFLPLTGFVMGLAYNAFPPGHPSSHPPSLTRRELTEGGGAVCAAAAANRHWRPWLHNGLIA